MSDTESSYGATYTALLQLARERDHQDPIPLPDRLCEIVDLTVGMVERGEVSDAIATLNSLKRIFSAARPLLNLAKQREKKHDTLVELMILRKEVAELKLERARSNVDPVEEAVQTELLKELDKFFSNASSCHIADV